MFKAGLILLYAFLELSFIVNWMERLESMSYDIVTVGIGSFRRYRVPAVWWISNSIVLFVKSFFLFCGMFILPLIQGVW